MNAQLLSPNQLLALRLQREKETVARLKSVIRNQQKLIDRPWYKRLLAL